MAQRDAVSSDAAANVEEAIALGDSSSGKQCCYHMRDSRPEPIAHGASLPVAFPRDTGLVLRVGSRDHGAWHDEGVSITPKTRKMLWGRAASRCSREDCRRELVMDLSDTDDPTIVGEEAHIVARESDGPRGADPLPVAKRDKYDNLLLLCSICHKLVDDNPAAFPIDQLKATKLSHEKWVRERLGGFDPFKQRDEEFAAWILEEWERRCELSRWDLWASDLMSPGGPTIEKARLDELDSLSSWLFRRFWPARFPDLRAAFETFRRVLSDLLAALQMYGVVVGAGTNAVLLFPKKQDELREWNPERHAALVAEREAHIELVAALVLELTRAANLICDQVRVSVLASYRLQEGLVVVSSGGFPVRTYRPEYPAGTPPASAYGGAPSVIAQLDAETRAFFPNDRIVNLGPH